LKPYPWYIEPLTHGILTTQLMVYETPYPWYFESLHMIYQTPYPWYIEPLPMVCWPPYPWYIKPHVHGISEPYQWYVHIPQIWHIELSTHGITMDRVFDISCVGTQNTMGMGFHIP
jgi:hypothetical protein